MQLKAFCTQIGSVLYVMGNVLFAIESVLYNGYHIVCNGKLMGSILCTMEGRLL